MKAALALTGVICLFAIAAATATAQTSDAARLHAAHGTLTFFRNHPRLMHGRTRPIALRALRTAGATIQRLEYISPLWQADARCETGYSDGGWYTRAGSYEGGIRFWYGTWDAWKGHVAGASIYDHADQAPAYLQARVAQWGLDHVGTWGCLHISWVWAKR